MNLFSIIVDGFAKIFFTRDRFLKHACLLTITGLLSLGSAKCQMISEEIKKLSQNSNVTSALQNFDFHSILGFVIGFVIVGLIIGTFLNGYNLKFIHNSFCENSDEVLPNIDLEPYKWFFNILPLYIVWGLTFVGIALLIKLCFVLPLLGVLLLIAFAILLIFLKLGMVFMQIKFAKTQDRTGLYNIFNGLSYMKGPVIGWLLLFGLAFFVLYSVIIFVPTFLIGAFAELASGLFGFNSEVPLFAGGVIGGYLGYVFQLLSNYCMVQIYNNFIDVENIPDETFENN